METDIITRLQLPHEDGTIYALRSGSIDVAEALVYPSGYVTSVHVNPTVRGRGHGKALMAWIQEDFDHLYLGVINGNDAAIGLYKATGFVRASVQPAGCHGMLVEMEWNRSRSIRDIAGTDQLKIPDFGPAIGAARARSGYIAAMIQIDEVMESIRAVDPEGADAIIARARDAVRFGSQPTTLDSLNAEYERACRGDDGE